MAAEEENYNRIFRMGLALDARISHSSKNEMNTGISMREKGV